jgi:hypothetical protein
MMQIKAKLRRLIVALALPAATAAATWVDPPAAGPQHPGESGLTVSRWEVSPAIAGRPIYLSMTLAGTQAVLDRMQTGPLRIEVHWVHDNAATAPGAPNLVTDLTIGRPDLAGALAGEVRRKGFFEWHSWARKDTMAPGTWTVSLTYPRPAGRPPVRCALQPFNLPLSARNGKSPRASRKARM